MFIHEFKKTFKIFIRQKSMLFWTLIFPLILGLFFKLALGNISQSFEFEPIEVGIKGELINDESFSQFIRQVENEEIIKVHKTDDEDILENKDIVAFISKEDKMIVKNSGIFQSIVESLLQTYNMNKAIIVSTLNEKNPNADIENIIQRDNHLKEKSVGENLDLVNTYFYTLVGMQIIYGYMWGLEVAYLLEANLSTKAKRNAISPTNKIVSLLSSLCVGYILNLAIVLFTMLVFNKILGIDFSNHLGQLLGLVALGCATGVIFGMVIGVSNKKDRAFKQGLGIGLSLLMSFLAGMMNSDIKILVAEKAPIINKVNPIALITDGIYSLYFYDTFDRFYINILNLAGVTLILMILTYVFTRGKQYDSL